MSDEQYFIDQEIGKATLACLDPAWDGAGLIIDLSTGNVGVLLRRLESADIGVPSDELQLAIGHLVQHHQDTGSELQRVIYTFRRQPTGKWKFEADFTYPEGS
jgi:hypothetical protein